MWFILFSILNMLFHLVIVAYYIVLPMFPILVRKSLNSIRKIRRDNGCKCFIRYNYNAVEPIIASHIHTLKISEKYFSVPGFCD